MRSFLLLPAVDVAAGRVSRAGQPADDERGGDPLGVALELQQAGAQWLHLVDLDSAFGRGSNTDLLGQVIRRLDVPVELAGGVRDEASLRTALSTGCARVSLATEALADRAWCAEAFSRYGERIAVSLDVRDEKLSARGSGWSGGELTETLDWLNDAGCARCILTDVTRDRALAGPNVELLRTACGRADHPVIASGGVASLDDLRVLAALWPLGLEGAILGSALQAGKFTFAEGLSVVR